MEHLAQLVRVALQSADLDAYRELLDPHVSWGPPDDEVSGCHNREEVLEWYQLARDSGVRADVVETAVKGDRILVGLSIHQAPDTIGGDALRWQILRVANGKVSDIRGFEERDEAVRRMG
jgi:SnoaL-like protein